MLFLQLLLIASALANPFHEMDTQDRATKIDIADGVIFESTGESRRMLVAAELYHDETVSKPREPLERIRYFWVNAEIGFDLRGQESLPTATIEVIPLSFIEGNRIEASATRYGAIELTRDLAFGNLGTISVFGIGWAKELNFRDTSKRGQGTDAYVRFAVDAVGLRLAQLAHGDFAGVNVARAELDAGLGGDLGESFVARYTWAGVRGDLAIGAGSAHEGDWGLGANVELFNRFEMGWKSTGTRFRTHVEWGLRSAHYGEERSDHYLRVGVNGRF